MQHDIYHTGHLQAHGYTGHSRRYIHTSHTDTEHADRSAVRCMAVAAHTDLTGSTEARHMNRMTDPVARS